MAMVTDLTFIYIYMQVNRCTLNSASNQHTGNTKADLGLHHKVIISAILGRIDVVDGPKAVVAHDWPASVVAQVVVACWVNE